MKKVTCVFIFLSMLNIYGQDTGTASVEDKVFGVEVGLFGVWGNYETKLTPLIALRTEFGLDFGFRKGVFTNNESVFAFIPSVSLEPRWYYNLKGRVKNDRPINGNTGAFLSFKTQYYPDLFVISNKDVSVNQTIGFMPKFGYRKVWNENFNYEFGIGIGRSINLDYDYWDSTAELVIRVGYVF
ncbi:hypothetical protein EV196_107248 [Mariniflexile fucanivorans]|uniref:Outer membrane protein with beta-barrel domain n=1 Tax=Mariniflexile fucanivorans TaxID=264023 RepID=A0A4R1RF59_9FLAO|nr:hypothetical protein [Mariniflexile fucanivorans]TCL64536.1 hypothetical protein EV196_107248 [Mariniflexile fucanivorans]